ncbi:MAG: 4-(cytidine 5'-diphospho)-2-C-methyl-D-erythritol kinase [Bryobacteraceae bacterium]|nr:4-(cytidine 5'-diphospho)-2-C-methyl-D-erythritol kinase [Bryobacteraceae bacterium]
MRSVEVKAFAKINLGLAVMGKRPDGFHDIATIFHTISLADRIRISFAPARRSRIEVTASVEIPGENIAARAARAVLTATHATGEVRIHIAKRIPMGGGLGGGSTDAAAVLLALPALTGKPLGDPARLALELGSDVPFFLRGGCAMGFGRGEELYPLPDLAARHGLLVTPQVHVSTKDAYAALGRGLTPDRNFPMLKRLQSLAWAIEARAPRETWSGDCRNDFEEVVFRQYPALKRLQRKLAEAGAAPARMTGSGAALFGFFPDASAVQAGREKLGAVSTVPFSLLRRSAYRSLWRQWLRGNDALRPAQDSIGQRQSRARA